MREEVGCNHIIQAPTLENEASTSTAGAHQDLPHTEEFLAVLAHELRNPLSLISNATKILGLDPVTEYGHEQAHKVIERQVTHMGRLIHDLIDFSRISTGRIHLHQERIDLVPLVRAVANDCRAEIEAAGLTLKISLPDSSAWIEGDAARLAQVVGNLIANSCKLNDSGGSIDLSLRTAGDSLDLTVSDTCIIADPFAHVLESSRQTGKSRFQNPDGLGLSVAKGLIELHGGQIDVETDKDTGRGRRITLMLPMEQGPVPVSSVPPAKEASPSWRVLVIEDHIDGANTLASLLRLFGHKSFVAHSGPDGIQAARQIHPDVILCDIGLPGDMDGYSVAGAIRNDIEIPSAYLIAITGYEDDDLQLARDAGFNMHLTKPVDPNRLEKVLQQLTLPQDVNSFRQTTLDLPVFSHAHQHNNGQPDR